MPLVRIDRDGHVAHLVLDNVARRNALSRASIADLAAAVVELDRDDDVHVVVVRGDGPAFSAGIDAQTLPDLSTAAGFTEVRGAYVDAYELLARMGKATVAQVHGAAIGAGFQLMLACDLRVIAEDATLGLPETRMGLVPDIGGCGRLAALCGSGRAKELILTSAMISGERALELGIANRVAPAASLDAVTAELVGELLRCSRHANALAKRIVDHAAEPTHAANLDAEAAAQLSCITTPQFEAAFASFAADPKANLK